jgi:HEAT repeat protein
LKVKAGKKMEEDNGKIGLNKVNDLITKLGNSDGSVRENARLALIDIGKEAVPGLAETLSSKQEQLRWEAAKTLVSIADPVSVPALIKVLRDEIFDIRWLAAEALIAIGKESIEPLLQAIINQSNDSFLQEGAHHIIAYLLPGLSKSRELVEILKPVKDALDSSAPRAAGPAAAQKALEKMKHMKIT